MLRIATIWHGRAPHAGGLKLLFRIGLKLRYNTGLVLYRYYTGIILRSPEVDRYYTNHTCTAVLEIGRDMPGL